MTTDRAGPACQHEEDRLSGVLGLVLIADDLATETQNHRPMPLHQGCEGGLGTLVAVQRESLEKLPIAQPPDRPVVEQYLQLLQDGPARASRHEVPCQLIRSP